jgi:hyperosmotically inducible protein
MMLRDYSVFDTLEFQVTGLDTVVLSGRVTRPVLKSEAESTIRQLEGVGKVVNKIEVLPPSPSDDRLRIAAYRAVFSKPGLDRYGLLAVPPVHIIVDNGAVTLVGIVASQEDKDLAGLAAREVPGTFNVTNNLRVEKK